MRKNPETKIIAFPAKDVALKLGLPEDEADMAVCNVAVPVKEYRRLIKSKEGKRSVDIVVANLALGAKFQGQSVGTNALFRITFPNTVYINASSNEPSWINLSRVRELLEGEGLTIKGSRKVAWNKQVLLRVLVSDELLVSPKEFEKDVEKDFPNLPKSLRARVMDGTLPTFLTPFYYSARSKPRAGKGGWDEVRIDLYKLSDMLDAPQMSESRHCGPRPNARQRGKFNRVEYGLCGSYESATVADKSVTTASSTGAYYVQWIGHFEDGEWVDEGSRLLLIPIHAINRARITYLKARLQPAVFSALSADALILPNTLMPANKSDDTTAEPANKPAQLKGPHAPVSGNGGKSAGGGDGSKATLGDMLGSKGQGLPPTAAANGTGAPAS
ncbi:MAG: hypothetical protein ACYC44_00325 [Patescibacteria group bacterium]